MVTFTVSKDDILNTEIISDTPGYCSFTIKSNSGFRGLKTTVLKPETRSFVTTPLLGGLINWREKLFEIGGLTKKWTTLKDRQNSIIHRYPIREWFWSDQKYVVKREDNCWTATYQGNSASSPAATFTSYKGSPTKNTDPEPATIMLASNIPHEEMVFLLLVLLWCEYKRLEAERVTRASGATIGVVGANIGIAAAVSTL